MAELGKTAAASTGNWAGLWTPALENRVLENIETSLACSTRHVSYFGGETCQQLDGFGREKSKWTGLDTLGTPDPVFDTDHTLDELCHTKENKYSVNQR